MGAWGYGPYDSDQALDYLGDTISDFIKSEITEVLSDPNHYDFHTRIRAIAQVAIDTKDFLYLGEAEVRGLVEALRAIPDEWINEWSLPGEVQKSIEDQIKSLIEIHQWAEV